MPTQPHPPWPQTYSLPSSPSLHVEDRFSILDSGDEEHPVPFWTLLNALLSQPITTPTSLVGLLETISLTLHGKSSDYTGLKNFLNSSTNIRKNLLTSFFSSTWPHLATLALKLPQLFPEHSLHVLSHHHTPKVVLTREQVACLVIHQFLGTLLAPPWQEGDWFHDLRVWFAGEQPHPQAVEAYLTALFVYLKRVAHDAGAGVGSGGEHITYEIVRDDSGLWDEGQTVLGGMQVQRLWEATTHPDVLGLGNGAAIISANKFIGFGRTGTQEEVHVGASPEVCPVVLVAPPLGFQDVVVVTGAEAVVSIMGYGRNARCEQVLEPTEEHGNLWSGRTMLFMDALELDLADQALGTPVDLQPGNVERDLRKAFVAFKRKRSTSDPTPMIFTGLWGCGTFGGNPGIKACIQWCAASLAGCDLTYICSGEEQQAFADNLKDFVQRIPRDQTAETLRRVLVELRPDDIIPGQDSLSTILSKLQ